MRDRDLKAFLQRNQQRQLAKAAERAKYHYDPNAERAARVTMEYMQAQERSQGEVIDAWNRYVEAALALTLQELSHLGVTEDDLELRILPPNPSDYSGETQVWVRGVHLLSLMRQNTQGLLDSNQPIEWEFSTVVVAGEAELSA